MQFRVPQFIDIEDKVVGPLTLKQFGYIVGAGGFSFIIWTFIPIKVVAFVLCAAVSALFLSLAFVKINNRPFADILESAFAYYTGTKIYTWKQPQPETELNSAAEKVAIATAQEKVQEIAMAKADKDRLHDLALGLDVLDRNPQQTEE
jgi:hypothetical protein